MALFDWLKYRFWKNRNRDIPENVFIEKPEDNIPEDNNDTKNTEPMYDLTSSTLGITYNGQLIQGIDSVHLFITIDRDKKGYNDALANSDASNLKDNLNLLDSDLSIVIDRALSFYEEKIEVQDNLIKSRNNFGLNELADEITTEKNKINELITKIELIKEEAKKKEGISRRMLLSYEIGFKRGLAAITATKLSN